MVGEVELREKRRLEAHGNEVEGWRMGLEAPLILLCNDGPRCGTELRFLGRAPLAEL
jgi:hypothetical protein